MLLQSRYSRCHVLAVAAGFTSAAEGWALVCGAADVQASAVSELPLRLRSKDHT